MERHQLEQLEVIIPEDCDVVTYEVVMGSRLVRTVEVRGQANDDSAPRVLKAGRPVLLRQIA